MCIRESPFENSVRELKEWDVYGYDPLLSDSMIKYFGVKPLPNLDEKMNAVIIAVAHKQFCGMTLREIRELMNDHPVLVDVRVMRDKKIVNVKDLYYQKL